MLFTAQLFFWPCVLIKDTYWANYSPQPTKRHIFSPPVRSHWHLLTKEETGQPQLASLLGPFEAAREWFILKMVWLSLSKPREIHLDAWSMTEPYQTEVQVVVHRLYEKGTGHHWASLAFSEQVSVYHAAFRLQCSIFIHASWDVPLLSPCMIIWNMHGEDTCTQKKKGMPLSSEIKLTNTAAIAHSYLQEKHAHTHTCHCMIPPPCVWPSATLPFSCVCWYREAKCASCTAICHRFNPIGSVFPGTYYSVKQSTRLLGWSHRDLDIKRN